MARTIAACAVLCCVTVFCSVVTFWGIQFTLTQIAEAASSITVRGGVRTSYVSTLSVTKPDALNAAKTMKVVPMATEAIGNATMQTAYTHTVSVESLRVRSGPNKATSQIFALKGGSKVRAMREEKGWILIEAGGRSGWVYHTLLRSVPPTRQAQL